MTRQTLAAVSTLLCILVGGRASGQALRLDELHRMLPAEARDTFHRLGDVEGDGDLDLLSFRAVPAVSLARNDGRGIFGEPAAFALPSFAGGLVTNLTAALLSDVDGDGDLDVLLGVAAWQPDMFGLQAVGAQNLLYRNDGAGFANVTASQMPALLDHTFSAASADLDGDGDEDLVLGNEPGFFLPFDALARNDGGGVFASASGALPSLSGRTDAIAVSDVDLDGDLDLLLHKPQHHLLINDGSGTFAAESFRLPALPGSQPLALGDLDGDGDPDALSVTARLANDGTGFFSIVAGGLPAGAPGSLPALADVDTDGLADAFVASPLGGLHLYLGDGSAFAEVAVPQGVLPPTGVQVGDVDGDGDPDAVLASKSQADLLLGDGTGQFLATSSAFQGVLALPGGNGGLLRDMDGDGHLDLVLTSTASTALRMLIGNGAGDFAEATSALSVASGNFRAPGAADTDGDGDIDLIVGAESGTNRLLRKDGPTWNEVPGAFPEPSGCKALAIADCDADGFVDVLFGQNFTNPTRLYRNDGSGGFVLAPGLPISGIVDDCLAADLDGNGTSDLVAVTSSSGFLLWNDGRAAFTLGASLGSGTCVAAADADADGDLDLAIGTGAGTSNRFLRNSGFGGFASLTLPSSTRRAMSVAFLDLDGDGLRDLYFANWDNGGSALDQLLRKSSGPGTGYTDVTSQLGARIDELSWEVLVGDVDEDGDEDAMVVGGRGILPYPYLMGATRLYSNLYRHLAWRGLPAIGKQLVLDQSGSPGGPYWLLAALAPGELELPPLGTLKVDPAAFEIFASGVLDAEGHNGFVLPIPRLPGLVGLSLYFQSALGDPVLLTNLERVTFTAF